MPLSHSKTRAKLITRIEKIPYESHSRDGNTPTGVLLTKGPGNSNLL